MMIYFASFFLCNSGGTSASGARKEARPDSSESAAAAYDATAGDSTVANGGNSMIENGGGTDENSALANCDPSAVRASGGKGIFYIESRPAQGLLLAKGALDDAILTFFTIAIGTLECAHYSYHALDTLLRHASAHIVCLALWKGAVRLHMTIPSNMNRTD